jgi:hypothetical protein
MRELMEKYRDLPMDLADASLARVAERVQRRRGVPRLHSTVRLFHLDACRTDKPPEDDS